MARLVPHITIKRKTSNKDFYGEDSKEYLAKQAQKKAKALITGPDHKSEIEDTCGTCDETSNDSNKAKKTYYNRLLTYAAYLDVKKTVKGVPESIIRQAVSLDRTTYRYYAKRVAYKQDYSPVITIMRVLSELSNHTLGRDRMRYALSLLGFFYSRQKISKLMKKAGVEAIYNKITRRQ